MASLLIAQPHPKSPALDRRTAAELLYFGSGFTLARIGNFLASQGDNLVVGRWLGAQALGLYGHAYQLMTAPAVMLGQVLDRVLFPTMALVQTEPKRLARAYRSGVSIISIFILPVSIVLAIVAPEAVGTLLGPGWEGVVPPLQILALGMMFRSSYKISDTIARATGAVYQRAWRQVAYACLVVGGSIVGQYWGLVGVAVGVLAAITINYLLMAHLSLSLTGMSWASFAAAHIPGIALAATVGTVTSALAFVLRASSASSIILLGSVALVSVILVCGLCWRFPAVFLGASTLSLIGSVTAFVPEKALRYVTKEGDERC
jgi:PST family polysaccharide transporter